METSVTLNLAHLGFWFNSPVTQQNLRDKAFLNIYAGLG